MARYLITGGCGFIGSHLADALSAAGQNIRVFDNLSTGKRERLPSSAEFVLGDVTDAAAVAEAMADADGCFHLAAIASVARCTEDWVGTHRINLGGAVNVFDAARRHGGIPVVYASSAAVYGDNPDVPLAEDAATRPNSAYGADKLGCELHGRVAAEVHRVPNVGIRIFNAYGPRQDPSSPYSGVISIFVNRLRLGEEITIFGDGQQTRDFIHVRDVVRFLLGGMSRAKSGSKVYNACTGKAVSIASLAETIAGLCGHTARLKRAPPRAGDIRHSVGDPAAALKALGMTADIALKDGLATMLAAH